MLMAEKTVAPFPRKAADHLENGDRLTAREFMRRYEKASDVNKAQLIAGIVYMPSPVRADMHGEPDGLIQLWLGYFSSRSEYLKVYSNTTLILDADNAVQPDVMLCSAPEEGGRVWLDKKGYLHGSPEFVCEIAASSASVDLHDKLHAYQRNGVGEYLVWLTEEQGLRWFSLEGDRLVEQEAEKGFFRSGIFEGLVLDGLALLEGDKKRLLGGLESV
jgi:hypothetical protein